MKVVFLWIFRWDSSGTLETASLEWLYSALDTSGGFTQLVTRESWGKRP